MKVWLFVVLLCTFASSCWAQEKSSDEFSRKNTWTVFAEESQTSSHILMGGSRQRKLIDLGFGYTRRVVRFWGTDLGYHVEVRPALFESDPLAVDKVTDVMTSPGQPTQTYFGQNIYVPYGKCISGTFVTTYVSPPGQPSETETVTDNVKCGREWTAGQSFSPLGFKWSTRTHHAIQPFLVGTLGYMYTSRPVPVPGAEAFNFLFTFGPGVEIFRRGKKSLAMEYTYSHFSNRDTAPENPGVDNMMLKVSCSFGR